MRVNRLLTNLCTNNLESSRKFYSDLFEFGVEYESDWFIHLKSIESNLEIGIIQLDHELVPEEYKSKPAGMYITLVVDDVQEIHKNARRLGYDVFKNPEVTFYGQKRLLLADPGGVLVDVSSPDNS